MQATVATKVYANAGNRGVLDRIPSTARRILDVGCGAGDNARVLRGRGAWIGGITLSEEEARLAGQVCDKTWIHDLEKGLPPDVGDGYDAILCSHVLEHLCFPARLLADIRAALAPGGVVVAAVPNLLYFKSRLGLLAGNFDYTESGLMDETHFRWYTYRTFPRLFERAGFTVKTQLAEGYVPLGPVRRVLPRAATWLDATASRALPGLFGFQIIVVAGVENRKP